MTNGFDVTLACALMSPPPGLQTSSGTYSQPTAVAVGHMMSALAGLQKAAAPKALAQENYSTVYMSDVYRAKGISESKS